MNPNLRLTVSICAGLITLSLLTWLTFALAPDPGNLLPGILFGLLIVFTTTFGVELAQGRVSLLPMTTVAACLVAGLVPAAWAAYVGALVHEVVRDLPAARAGPRRKRGLMRPLGVAAANASIQSLSILGGGAIFKSLDGITPLTRLGQAQVLPLLFLCLTYLAVNYVCAGIYIAARGREALNAYLRILPNALLYEGAPLLFAPLMALTYTQLGLGQFIPFALILVVTSLITNNLASTSSRLERRLRELDSLQAVGQALSASLDQETILSAIYTQVAHLMPAQNFYVALYDGESDEVSFPLAIEEGEQKQWRSRRMGGGMTEHILHTQAPLLLKREVGAGLQELGLDQIGRVAASWLGVPMMAGAEPLGVIAVQSYDAPDVYDESHQEVLVTIASQAAVAIENARLYARTDEALARRVQELASILQTTHEGILLLDRDWRVLAANRALSDYVGFAQAELSGRSLRTPLDEGVLPLTLIGYTEAELAADCQSLLGQEDAFEREEIVTPGPPERQVERTLAPVRDRGGRTSGWLLVLRDVTEERELARLRDELTHMLIHDLRSPLAALKSGLDLIDVLSREGDTGNLDRVLSLARQGGERMLHMINQLLDVNRLESGQMPVHAEATDIRGLFENVAAQLGPLAGSAEITVQIAVDPDLPLLDVDPELIGRVVHNLLDNAIKFTPARGRIQLWAHRDPQAPAGESALVGVTDTGLGIPEEERGRIFLKFQQVTSSKEGRPGTGLGLAFCKLAVEAHGGQIWVESEWGEGSTFVARLPLIGTASVSSP